MNGSPIPSARQWLVVCWLLLTAAGMAHPILQNPMWVEVAPTVLEVKIYVSVRELNVVQGLPIALDGSVDTDLAVETAPRHSAYVLDHLSLSADGVPLTGTVTSIDPPQTVGKGTEGPDRAHFIYRLEYPMASPPARIALSHTMVKEFPSAPGVPWDLSYTYRFGPPGATPVQFGSITRDVVVTYDTGFAQPAGTAPVASILPAVWPLGLRLFLLGAALGLGVPNRWMFLRVLAVTAVSWAAGWAAGWLGGIRIPIFLAAALGGIGILLVSVDNIHRPPAFPAWRRWVMAGVFSGVAGLAGWQTAAGANSHALRDAALLLGGCIIGAGIALAMAQPGRDRDQAKPAASLWVQLASLAVCAGGLVVLLEGLGLRPWAYWVSRLSS